jgi:nucleotide-binding universal stress UspA family protein
VLVPTDFSAAADAALALATLIAKRAGDGLDLLHVVDDRPSARFWSHQVLTATLADMQERLVNSGWERLAIRAVTVVAADLAVTQDVQVGPIAPTVNNTAAAMASSLIVTGTRGQTGLPHVVLGSIAEQLVRTAPCPVLAVHTSRPAIRRILAATDFGEAADAALHEAATLARLFDASLHIVHVVQDPWPMGPDGYVRTADEIRTLMAEDAARLLTERLCEVEAETTSEVVFGMPSRAITDAAARKNADLIVLGTHGRGALAHVVMGSVADRVMRMANCPVLTTRSSYISDPVAVARGSAQRSAT